MEIFRFLGLFFGVWIMAGAVVVVLWNFFKHLPQIVNRIRIIGLHLKIWHQKQSYDFESKDTDWDRDHPSVKYERDHRQPNFD